MPGHEQCRASEGQRDGGERAGVAGMGERELSAAATAMMPAIMGRWK